MAYKEPYCDGKSRGGVEEGGRDIPISQWVSTDGQNDVSSLFQPWPEHTPTRLLWMLGRSASFNGVDCYGQQGFKPIENFIKCIGKSQYGIHEPPETNQEWFSSWGGWKLLQDCSFSFSRDCCNCATKTVCSTNAELFYRDLQENIDFCSISLKAIEGRRKNVRTSPRQLSIAIR